MTNNLHSPTAQAERPEPSPWDRLMTGMLARPVEVILPSP